jgi:hypothetical protein
MGYVVVLYLYLRSASNVMEVNGLQVDTPGGALTVYAHPPGENYPTLAACEAALKTVGTPNVGVPYNISNKWCQAAN